MIDIRAATDDDAGPIWEMLEPTLRAGDVFTLPRDMHRVDALAYWFAPAHDVHVAERGGAILGSYYIRANQTGGGAHVANAGYLTAAAARGQGIARAMCGHSLTRAASLGFRAMQFNFVVSTNMAAVHLWTSLDFATVGRLPGAFDHPQLGVVDALVMFRALTRD
jgi:GNAT superfamily N-acetyltransferase